MKSVLVAVFAFVAVSAQAQEKIVDRSEATGSEAVVQVGTCNVPQIDANNMVSSQFPYAVCVETKHYKAKVIKHEDRMWSKTSYEPIPGTERLTYSLETRTNGDTREAGQNPAMSILESMAACGKLRSAMGRAIVEVRNTGCGR